MREGLRSQTDPDELCRGGGRRRSGQLPSLRWLPRWLDRPGEATSSQIFLFSFLDILLVYLYLSSQLLSSCNVK